MANLTAFVNTKGGSGKTTTALLTALALSERGNTITFVDSDPQASATQWAQITAEVGSKLPFDVVQGFNPYQLEQAVKAAAASDFIIIDTPPGTPDIIDTAIRQAHLVLVPTQPTGLDVDRMWATLQLLEHVPHAVVLNRVDFRTTLARTAKATLEAGGVTVANTTIPQRASISAAFGANPRVNTAYLALADEIMEVFS